MARYTKRGLAICDRTGFEYPRSEMVKEKGTGYLVHRSVDDGEYNAVTHPQITRPNQRRLPPEGLVVKDARPPQAQVNNVLVDENGEEIVFSYMFGGSENIDIT
jgi:hypothetical protein